MRTKKIAYMSLLTAIALTIFMVEAQLPAVIPLPGVKLGLANIVTVFAVFTLGPGPAAMILLVRVLLGSLFSGQLMTLFYSLGGGLLCLAVMSILRLFLTRKQIWVCSVIGAVFHNLGQLIVAILITSTPLLATYLPVLIISGVLTGAFTGVCAQLVVKRMDKKGKGKF